MDPQLIKKIKDYMYGNDIFIKDMAEHFDICPAYLTRILQGKQAPSERLLWKIDKFFELKPVR